MSILKTEKGLSAPVAFLGPEGTFSHIVARRRYGTRRKLVPCNTIEAIFDYVKEDHSHSGVVPIENSSGGNIYDTIDLLIQNTEPLYIQEELSLDVQLALLGHKNEKIRTIYSHFVPLHHYKEWLRKNFPKVEQRTVSSTALAAKNASEELDAAALCAKGAAEIYGLDVLKFPIEKKETNVTHFFTLGHKAAPSESGSKTALAVVLKNTTGSLYSFLEPFAKSYVNLTRIVSRPIHGHPNTYIFFMEIEGTKKEKKVHQALVSAEKMAKSIKNLGSYPLRPRYQS